MATDYARVAKRISAITTNCLLTAVVLAAGLGFGRQVLRWWRADTTQSPDASQSTGALDGLGDPSQLHAVQFGDQTWSLRRRSIAGNRQAAAAALRTACGEVVRQDRLPDQPPGPAERDLLRRLAARDPAEQEPGRWRLYELTEALPTVVGTRATPPTADARPGETPAALGGRVVVLGVALPAGENEWTILSFQPEGPGGVHPTGLPAIPIPGGCRRTLSMSIAGGGAVLAFEGPQEPSTWLDFYDRWFSAHHWSKAAGWRRSGAGWHARYVPRVEDSAASVEVHLGSDGPQRGSGLLMIIGE